MSQKKPRLLNKLYENETSYRDSAGHGDSGLFTSCCDRLESHYALFYLIYIQFQNEIWLVWIEHGTNLLESYNKQEPGNHINVNTNSFN